MLDKAPNLGYSPVISPQGLGESTPRDLLRLFWFCREGLNSVRESIYPNQGAPVPSPIFPRLTSYSLYASRDLRMGELVILHVFPVPELVSWLQESRELAATAAPKACWPATSPQIWLFA